MLAADAQLDVAACRQAAFHCELYQLANAIDIQADEGIAAVDAFLDIGSEEASGVVTAYAQRGLRQVVGAEAEEARLLGDLARHQRGARQFDSWCRPCSRA